MKTFFSGQKAVRLQNTLVVQTILDQPAEAQTRQWSVEFSLCNHLFWGSNESARATRGAIHLTYACVSSYSAFVGLYQAQDSLFTAPSRRQTIKKRSQHGNTLLLIVVHTSAFRSFLTLPTFFSMTNDSSTEYVSLSFDCWVLFIRLRNNVQNRLELVTLIIWILSSSHL